MQKVYYQYLANDDTFSLNLRHIGVLPYGRYRGFEFSPLPSMTLRLVHTTTGVRYPNTSLVMSDPTGVVITKQGCVVFEDAAVEVAISPNATTDPRIDLIVVSHEYQLIAGGVNADYLVLEGTPSATPVPPTITEPEKMVVIGTLYLPANTSSLNGVGVTYTPTLIPELGNNNLGDRFNALLNDFADIVQQFGDLETAVTNFFTTVNAAIAAQQLFIENHVPIFRNNGTMLQWKYVFEPNTAWRDLGVPLMIPYSGAGTIEVHIAGLEPLPVATGDRNIIQFTNIVTDPQNVWLLTREYFATQTRNYSFVLDTLQFTVQQDFNVGTSDYTDVVYLEVWKNNALSQVFKIGLVWTNPFSATTITTGTVKSLPQIAFTVPMQPLDKIYLQLYIPTYSEAVNDTYTHPNGSTFVLGTAVTSGFTFLATQNDMKNRLALTSGHLYTV